jgi:signal peptidase II
MPKTQSVIKNHRLLWWHGIALTVFFLDQITKAWAVHALAGQHVIRVFSWFNLSLAFNQGAAFSFLADGSGWQRGFLIAFALFMMGLLIWWLQAALKRTQSAVCVITGLGLLFGGALGNLIDRFQTGRVVDFIQWYYQDWYWPTFNIADMAICVGIVCLALDIRQADIIEKNNKAITPEKS